MSIYKRGKYWWINFKSPNGEYIQRSTKTENKQQAQELHDRLKAGLWNQKHLGTKPKYTWNDAVVRWMAERQHKKSIEADISRLRWLDPHLSGRNLDDINRQVIDQIKQSRQREGSSNGTINRTLALIRAILNMAYKEWEWIDSVPAIKQMPEPQGRIRWLTHAEADRLIKELPDHLKFMVRFALATGLRESNITGLEWSQVDLKRRCAWIHGDQAKGKKPIAVPLNDEAISVIRAQIGKHEVCVFTYEGQPMRKAHNHAFDKALVRAGIEDFTFHGLRHTWASWHIQNGTPVHVLKELGGWSDLKLVQRYAHLSADHLAEYAGNTRPAEYDQKLKLVRKE
jgi:integrase